MMIMMLNACDGRRSSIRRLTILWAKGFVVVVMGGGGIFQKIKNREELEET